MGTHTIEKIYDESRAALASNVAVLQFTDKEEEIWYNALADRHIYDGFDSTIETQCWEATEEVIGDLHDMEENYKVLPSPPLYIETLNNVDLFKVKKPSPVERPVASIMPRFSKMNKVGLLEWLATQREAMLVREQWSMVQQIDDASMKDSRKILEDLCERVWETL